MILRSTRLKVLDYRPNGRWQTSAAFAVCFVVFFCVTMIWSLSQRHSLDDLPAPWNTDGVFYDNVAFNLDAGGGFRVDLDAQPWRSSYTQANESDRLGGEYDWLMPVKGKGPTALRSPAYPSVLALIYRGFGRRFDVVRIFGCVFVSLGVGLLLTFCMTHWGLLPALIAGVTVTLDYSVMNSASTVATESLAIAVFATTFIFAARAFEDSTLRRWMVCGVAFGFLMMTRGIWSLGLLIMIAIWIACVSVAPLRRRFTKQQFAYGAVFLVASMSVASPWWIRNCMVTEHFQPFGTAGSCGFVAAYCDESLANYGQWQPEVFNENQTKVQADFDLDSVSLAHLEYAIGQESLRRTVDWSLSNWIRIPKLMCFRAISHWGFFNNTVPVNAQVANFFLIVVGLFGCFCCTGKFSRVFIFVLVLDSLLVMLTWVHLGRYAIPIRPVVHVGFGLASAAVVRLASRQGGNGNEHNL